MANRETKDMRTYPAIFSKDKGGISVEFPDLPGCLTCAKSEVEAVARAKEAKRSVTKSVTLPAWLNKLGMQHNLNFSSLLYDSIKERLDVK